MAALAALGPMLGAVSSGISAFGTIAGGIAAKKNADYQATQEDMAAQESRASSQRQAIEDRRKAGLALSTLQANAAASGAGASDPTVSDLVGQVAGRGEYQALTDMYTGENKALGLEDQATGLRAQGSADLTGSFFKGAGTILSGASSYFDRYNRLKYG